MGPGEKLAGSGGPHGVELLPAADHHLYDFIFYGHGLGLYGSVSRVGQALIVLAVWAALLVLCPFWLKRFRFGPFEWLWRSLTYMKLQPLKVERSVA